MIVDGESRKASFLGAIFLKVVARILLEMLTKKI